MTYYTLANADIVNVPSEKRVLRLNNEKIKHRTIVSVLAGFLIVISAVYIFAINSMIGGVYEIRALNKKLEELNSQNRALEIEAARQRSIPEIQSLIAPLNLVAVDKVEYIDINKNKDASLALVNPLKNLKRDKISQ